MFVVIEKGNLILFHMNLNHWSSQTDKVFQTAYSDALHLFNFLREKLYVNVFAK